MFIKFRKLLLLITLLVLVLTACGPAKTSETSEFDCTIRLGAPISETGNFAREGVWNQRIFGTIARCYLVCDNTVDNRKRTL